MPRIQIPRADTSTPEEAEFSNIGHLLCPHFTPQSETLQIHWRCGDKDQNTDHTSSTWCKSRCKSQTLGVVSFSKRGVHWTWEPVGGLGLVHKVELQSRCLFYSEGIWLLLPGVVFLWTKDFSMTSASSLPLSCHLTWGFTYTVFPIEFWDWSTSSHYSLWSRSAPLYFN